MRQIDAALPCRHPIDLRQIDTVEQGEIGRKALRAELFYDTLMLNYDRLMPGTRKMIATN